MNDTTIPEFFTAHFHDDEQERQTMLKAVDYLIPWLLPLPHHLNPHQKRDVIKNTIYQFLDSFKDCELDRYRLYACVCSQLAKKHGLNGCEKVTMH